MCYIIMYINNDKLQFDNFGKKKKMIKLNIDCISLILNQMDKNSLYSCLLVNKEWCNVVVPILWKEYSYGYGSKKLLNTILSCLPPSSKQLLSDNDITLPSTILLKNPLFN